MKISVVICTYDNLRLSDTESAINSVLSQTYTNFEIIVIVDRNKELYKILKNKIDSPKISILLSEKAGLSACRNLALRHIQGDAVAFLDDDAVADPEWLNNISKCYSNESVLCVGGKIDAHSTTPIFKSFPKEMYWIFGCTYNGHPKKKGEIRNTFGSNISFKKRIFNDVGIFDSTFGRVDKKNTTAEETELCVRIRQHFPNSKIIFEPEAIIHHKVYPSRQNFRFILKRAYGEGFSKAKVRKKFKNKDVLFVESNILSYIIKESIPSRLKNILKGIEPGNNLLQIVNLILISSIVITGFIIGNIKS